jgi:hypothetical protein
MATSSIGDGSIVACSIAQPFLQIELLLRQALEEAVTCHGASCYNAPL